MGSNSMIMKDKNMIDPSLLMGSPLPPPTRPPPPLRPVSPTSQRGYGSWDASSVNRVHVHHPSAQVELDDRTKYEPQPGLDYLDHFPAPPYKTSPTSQRSDETQECHTTNWPSTKTDQQLLNAAVLKHTRSWGKHSQHHPFASQLSPNPMPEPLRIRPQLASSSSASVSPPSSSAAESHRLPHSASLLTFSSTPPSNPFHSEFPIRSLEIPTERPRSSSLSSLDYQGTCSESLRSAVDKKIGRLEFGEHWMNLQTEHESQNSKPLDLIASDLDYSFRRLININVFEQLLEDPSGRHTFRQAIVDGLSPDLCFPSNLSLAKLDLWLDCKGINHILEILKSCSLGLHDIYLNSHSVHLEKILPNTQLNELANSIRTIQSLQVNATNKSLGIQNQRNGEEDEEIDKERRGKPRVAGVEEETHQAGSGIELKSIENYLLRSLYQNEFPLYIKKTLISNVKVRLGKVDLTDSGQDGMGECFCLTNPRLRDHPIVLVSDGFTKVTGYDRNSIIGKNCRFLQGPGTSPHTVQRIRDGLNSGEGCTELLLNYRKDGTPFYCLLTIIPFRDITGALIYFIGGQINVTGMLSSKKGLSFLMTDPNGATLGPSKLEKSDNLLGLNQYSLSRNMQQFSSREASLATETKSVLGDIKNKDRGNSTSGDHNAAGSITFDMPSHDKENSSFPKRLFRRLAGINNRDQRLETAFTVQSSDQKLVGAEGWFHEPKPLNEHIKNFETTYSQLLIFKRDSRRVIFATREVLDLFGCKTAQNKKAMFNSKLIQSDFAELIWPFTPHNKAAVSHLRNQLKEIIKCGMPMSLDCQVKLMEHKTFFSSGKDETLSGKLKPTKIHLTPLKDKDGIPVAFTCLFGPRDQL